MIALLPSWCLHCRRFISKPLRSPSAFLCSRCLDQLPVIEPPICNHCGLKHRTNDCRESWAKPIDSFQSIFYYRDPVHHWIVNHKYSSGLFAGRLLREFVTGWFKEHAGRVSGLDAVLPVPIHPLRLRQRGFNQTAFLLKAQRLLPLKTGWLKKKRFTPQQAGLTGKSRRENVRGSFAVKTAVASKKLLIFDDVCTTGQTLGEVCRCLKKAGAAEVHILTLSRSM